MNIKLETRILTYYEALGATDHDTNPYVFSLGYFLNKSAAIKAAKGKGGWGTDGKVKELTGSVVVMSDQMFILGDLISQDGDSTEDIKSRALAKLSDEEREALGLQ